MIYLMSGIPGIGKSTYVKNNKRDNDVVISRDDIRFTFLEPDGNYFDHEKEVLNTFYEEIEKATTDLHDYDIYIDATHISPKTRRRTMGHILNKDYVICVSFYPNAEKAIAQNKTRTGIRKTPIQAILNQECGYINPTLEEGFDAIIRIDYPEE